MDLWHMNVGLKWCMCMLVVDLGIVMIVIIIIIIIIKMLYFYILFCFVLFFSFFFLLCFFFCFFSFLECVKCVCGLRCIWCGRGVACYVECLNVALFVCLFVCVFVCLFVCCVYTGGRTDFTRGNLSPNLQARFCKLYPANFLGWNWVVQVNSWFPKKSKSRIALLVHNVWGPFSDRSQRQKPARLVLLETRPTLFEKIRRGIFLQNETQTNPESWEHINRPHVQAWLSWSERGTVNP